MPVAELPPLPEAPDLCVVCRRNDPLGTGPRWTIFGALAAVSFALAAAFAAAGAWLVLPYSALEVAVLAWAFRYMQRRVGDWERLTISGDSVMVERCENGRRTRQEWNRYWVQVEWQEAGEAAGSGWIGGDRSAPRLALRSGGVSCELGAALPAGERRALARTLRRILTRP